MIKSKRKKKRMRVRVGVREKINTLEERKNRKQKVIRNMYVYRGDTKIKK